MDDVRKNIANTVAGLEELENRARRLTNQNLADVVKSASGRLRQLADHPDLHMVADKPADDVPATTAEAVQRMRVAGEKDPEGAAKAKWPQLFGQPLPFNPNAGDTQKSDTFKPGDPKFNPANPDFKNPDNVNLNPDGTAPARQAPNSIGAQPDVRPQG